MVESGRLLSDCAPLKGTPGSNPGLSAIFNLLFAFMASPLHLIHILRKFLCHSSLLAAAVLLFTGGFPASGAPTPGAAYLDLASSVADAGGYEISGELKGTFGTSPEVTAVVVDSGGTTHFAFVGGASLPPLGSKVSFLMQPGDDGSVLAAWAFEADVERLRTSASKTPPASNNLDARKKGPAASRGNFDHTQYLDSYVKAIKGLNPRLDDALVRDLARVLLNTSNEFDIDPRLILALVYAESNFNPRATSPKGAMGLGQLMPATAKGMGLSNAYDPVANLDASIKILRSSISRYSGGAAWKDVREDHIKLALAAYNAGSGAVRRHGGIPPYRETQNYIAKVTSYYKQLKGNQ